MLTAAGILAIVLLFGVWIGTMAGQAVPPVTFAERDALASEARMGFDNPFLKLIQLSYRVERIPDPEPGPCGDKRLDGWTGTDQAAWHVTAYTVFGLPAGGITITCGGGSAD